ncbi:Gfo/Idh/MocA family protein [Micromonospora sp. CPCC 206061]|uniref:Gfo/Idh/MocA family protein n=1 Tax=Micromonospora sp. CPCC 206061 TaxID=3122410 RepID=UPI002FF0B70A
MVTRPVALVGAGRWGTNILRVMSGLQGVEPVVVRRDEADLHPAAPGVPRSLRVFEALADPGIGAVVIATPTHTHAELTARFLAAGKHVLVEKPLCTSPTTAGELEHLARDRRLVLRTGHVFLHHPAFASLAAAVAGGSPLRISAAWHKPVPPDLDLGWELLPHPVGIAHALVGRAPDDVAGNLAGARGVRVELRWHGGSHARLDAYPSPPNSWRLAVATTGVTVEWTAAGLQRHTTGPAEWLAVPPGEALVAQINAFLAAIDNGHTTEPVPGSAVVATIAAALGHAAGPAWAEPR